MVQGQRAADEQHWKLADSSLAAPYFDDGIQKLVLDWHLAIVKNSVYMQVIFVYNKIFLPVSCFILQIYQSNQPRKLISEYLLYSVFKEESKPVGSRRTW